jgi:Tfp pilus assembly protein PilF
LIDRSEIPSAADRLVWPALVLLPLAVFWPVVTFGFLNWDDRFHLLDNPLFQPPSIDNIRHYWSRPYMGLYIPLTYTVWTLIGTVTMSPAAFHAANLVLHVGCTVLVFLIVRQLIGSTWPAAIGAGIFAVHPLVVEPVAWVSGFRDVLGAVLMLLSIWFHLKHARRTTPLYFTLPLHLCILCFLAALLAKPTAVVTPLIILILGRLMMRPVKLILLETAPMFVLAIACAVLTKWIQPSIYLQPAPLWARPLVAGDALAFYLFKLFWPTQLCFDYGRTPQAILHSGQIWVSWLTPLCLAIACALSMRRQQLGSAAALVFLVGLLPVLGLVPFDFQEKSTVADRYVYVSMLGAALAAAAVVRARDSIRFRAVAASVVVALAVASWIQTRTWRDTRTMATHGLSINPRSFAALDLLAWEAFDDQNHALAERLSRESLDINPDDQTALINLGRALALQDRPLEALEPTLRAVAVRKDDAEAHANLCAVYYELGRYDQAMIECETALKLNPQHRPARYLRQLIQQRMARPPATTRSSE